MTPKNCHDGVSFSIWEKVHYKTDVFNVYKEHDRQYIFSTGGDYDYDQKKAYPGMALYHQGMNLVAVVSTGDDVWSLSVTGQLLNETWANIGVTSGLVQRKLKKTRVATRNFPETCPTQHINASPSRRTQL